MSVDEFQCAKIEVTTHVLKVQIHCQGCARKVRRVLKKIEGVYQVSIDADEQKVMVSGTVDCATLIRKLMKSGKHAELWAPSHRRSKSPQGLTNLLIDDKNQHPFQILTNDLRASSTQPMMASVDGEFGGLGRETYLNESARIKSRMSDNNFTAVGNIPQLAWDGDLVASAHCPEGNIRSILGLQDFANNAGGFSGLEDTELARLQNFQMGLPSYGHHYSPLLMRNNMNQHQYNLSSPLMVNTGIPDLYAFRNIPVHENTYMLQHQRNMNPMFNMFPPTKRSSVQYSSLCPRWQEKAIK